MVSPLEAPTAVDPRHDAVEFVLGASLVAPSWYLSKFCETVLGVEPLDKVTEFFTGDWKAIDRASGALATLAQFNEESALAIRDRLQLMSSWSGSSSLGAHTYFEALASAMNNQAPVLRELAETIDQFARAVYEQAKVATTGVEAVFDFGATALIFKAAAEAAAASGNVPAQVQLMGISALNVEHLIKRWNWVLAGMGVVWTLAQQVESVVRNQLASGELQTLPSLPRIAYDNPGV